MELYCRFTGGLESGGQCGRLLATPDASEELFPATNIAFPLLCSSLLRAISAAFPGVLEAGSGAGVGHQLLAHFTSLGSAFFVCLHGGHDDDSNEEDCEDLQKRKK